MKFNDNKKLQPTLNKIQKTNRHSLNILQCRFPYLLKMLNQMIMICRSNCFANESDILNTRLINLQRTTFDTFSLPFLYDSSHI
jgi:hypothetical protein